MNHEELKQKRRQSWTLTIAILAVLGLAGVSTWGYYQSKELRNYQILMENQYNRAFLDLTGYVNNVEVLLAKSLITSQTTSTSGMLEEIWRQANLAQTNIGQLPVAPPVLEKTSNFLTQVGDLAYALNTKTVEGGSLSDKEYDTLKKLHGYAISLQKSLSGIEDQINMGKMFWGLGTSNDAPRLAGTAKKSNVQADSMENVDKNFQEYPSLIYDGPYSDHMLNIKPLGLKSDKVTADQAKEVVRKLLGYNDIKEIKQLESGTGDTIKTYRFSAIFKDSDESTAARVEITQQGGQLYWMLRNRNFGKDTINMQEAKKVASAFLEKNGFKNMVDTYYEKTDGTAIISYAYSQDNVRVYADLVKVKVALDNGEVVGIESKGYLYNHRVREIPKAKLSPGEARKQIKNKINVTGERMAIIPTDFNTEKYCYEFHGKVDDRDFIIYINALNGQEEDVLLLIQNENGTLTM